VEGQAAIGSQTLNDKSVGSTRLEAGQTLSTENGRAEILLTPGVFVRLGNHSSLQMVSPTLENTTTNLEKGRAMVEVAEIRPANNIRVEESNFNTKLLKPGLYDFDADHGLIRVFDGKAEVQTGDRNIEVKGGHELDLDAGEKLKAQKFDKNAAEDDFYRWASLRSSYLSEANVDTARRYGGGSGWSAVPWYGDGWYWSPFFSAYTFIPANGIFYDPFGWGFYSPWVVYGAPYWGYGGYWVGGYHRHFGPGYRPPFVAGSRPSGFVGRSYHVPGGAVRSPGVSGFRSPGAGGFRGAGAGGFHGSTGGGFHGGGHGR